MSSWNRKDNSDAKAAKAAYEKAKATNDYSNTQFREEYRADATRKSLLNTYRGYSESGGVTATNAGNDGKQYQLDLNARNDADVIAQVGAYTGSGTIGWSTQHESTARGNYTKNHALVSTDFLQWMSNYDAANKTIVADREAKAVADAAAKAKAETEARIASENAAKLKVEQDTLYAAQTASQAGKGNEFTGGGQSSRMGGNDDEESIRRGRLGGGLRW